MRRAGGLSSMYEELPFEEASSPVGKPTERRHFEVSEAIALLFSFLCSAISLTCCFNDTVAARLGQNNQLIVVGLTLSLMDLCTSKLSTIVFLQLETRWNSLVQNYDVIIKRGPLSSLLNGRRGNKRWTVLLSIAVAFPLILSASYKLFTGGKVDVRIKSDGGLYGLTGPVGFRDFPAGTSLMVNATIPFTSSIPTGKINTPRSYGFSMLLLGGEPPVIAMLDAPSPEYIDRIRKDLKRGEIRKLSANVNGLAWKLDLGIEETRGNQTMWDGFFNSSASDRPRFVPLYKELKLLAALWPRYQLDHFFLHIADRVDREITVSNEEFQKSAIGFRGQRRKCSGTWSIAKDSTSLVDGKCAAIINDEFPKSCKSLHMQLAVFAIADFIDGIVTTSKLTEEAQLRLTAVVSALFWSRLTAYCGIDSTTRELSEAELSQVQYYVKDLASTTVYVMNPSPGLAMVLLAQPIVGLILFCSRIVLKSSPISGNFGLMNVLAGYKSRNGKMLMGAGLSGEASEPIELIIYEDSYPRYENESRLRYEAKRVSSSNISRGNQAQRALSLRGNITYY